MVIFQPAMLSCEGQDTLPRHNASLHKSRTKSHHLEVVESVLLDHCRKWSPPPVGESLLEKVTTVKNPPENSTRNSAVACCQPQEPSSFGADRSPVALGTPGASSTSGQKTPRAPLPWGEKAVFFCVSFLAEKKVWHPKYQQRSYQ